MTRSASAKKLGHDRFGSAARRDHVTYRALPGVEKRDFRRGPCREDSLRTSASRSALVAASALSRLGRLVRQIGGIGESKARFGRSQIGLFRCCRRRERCCRRRGLDLSQTIGQFARGVSPNYQRALVTVPCTMARFETIAWAIGDYA